MKIVLGGQEYWNAREFFRLVGKTVSMKWAPDIHEDMTYDEHDGRRPHLLYLAGRADIIAFIQETKQRDIEWEAEQEKKRLAKRTKGVSKTDRTEYAGVGTRIAKLRLNRQANTSVYAKALRIALEIEDTNLTAKKYHGGNIGGYTYDQLNYLKKAEGIESLIEIATTLDWVWGVQKADASQTTHVIYFDFPGVGQVSWHYSPKPGGDLPTYPGTWDGRKNSILGKLEKPIKELVNP